MNKEIEKIDENEIDEIYSELTKTLIDKLNELIEVVNSLIKDEEETKPKGKTK